MNILLLFLIRCTAHLFSYLWYLKQLVENEIVILLHKNIKYIIINIFIKMIFKDNRVRMRSTLQSMNDGQCVTGHDKWYITNDYYDADFNQFCIVARNNSKRAHSFSWFFLFCNPCRWAANWDWWWNILLCHKQCGDGLTVAHNVELMVITRRFKMHYTSIHKY